MTEDRVPNRVNKSKLLTMRFPEPLVDRILTDINETGEFRSLTEWMISATRFYLREREKERVGGGVQVSLNQRKKNSSFIISPVAV